MNKQTIMLKAKEETDIVTNHPSITTYIDSNFFTEVVGEDETNKSFLTFATNF
jgi:hypothetical protein